MTETTRDAFLGGRLQIRQPVTGYRAGIDPVLLAASIPAERGESVLELGTGSGVALLCLMARVPDLEAVGVERNTQVAELAAENAVENGLAATMIASDLTHLPPAIRDRAFDHVLANPPFFDRDSGSLAHDPAREGGRGVDTPLADWIDVAIRRIKPGGHLTIIQRAERLPELLSCLDGRVGGTLALPFAARAGKHAKLVILQARKGARAPFRLVTPFVLHDGAAHLTDCDDYTREARSILRNGAFLDLQSFITS